MSDLERLSISGSTDERDLVRAARDLRPSSASKQRAMLGLGLASATALTPTTAVAVAKSIKATLGAAWPLFASKWTAAALIVTVGASVAVVRSQRLSATPPQRPEHAAAVPAPIVQSPPPLAHSPSVASRRSEPEATTNLGSPNTQVSPGASSPKRVAAPSPTEVELFDAARARLSTGDSAGALKVLGEQLHTYPGGNLALEAKALRIEALDGMGQRQRALAEAQAFLAQNPSGLTSHRVRRWLEKRSMP